MKKLYTAVAVTLIALTVHAQTSTLQLNEGLSATLPANNEGKVTTEPTPEFPEFTTTALAGTKENDLNAAISIYPNPNSSVFTLTTQNVNSKLTLEIYNASGENVYTSIVNKQKTEIDLRKQPKGIYFAFLTDENKYVVSRKIVVE